MVKKLLYTLALGAMAFGNAQTETVVNFTTDEGFTDGPLYSQTDWDGVFATNTWQVDATNGFTYSDFIWKRAVWGVPYTLTNVGDQLTFRVEFNFSGTMDINAAGNANLFNIGFTNSNDASAAVNTISQDILNYGSSAWNQSINIKYNNMGSALSTNVSQTMASLQGDDVALEVTIELGADAASSKIYGQLFNITDNVQTVIGSYTGVQADMYAAVTGAGVYGVFHTQDFSNKHPITGINVVRVSMTEGDDVLSTPIIKQSKFTVSPNPSNGVISLQGVKVNTPVAIYSVTGAQVFTTSYNGAAIDLSNLLKGIYIIRAGGTSERIILM